MQSLIHFPAAFLNKLRNSLLVCIALSRYLKPFSVCTAKLEVETDSFGSRIRIKGVKTGYYICMNKRGKLIGKVSWISESFFFTEVL